MKVDWSQNPAHLKIAEALLQARWEVGTRIWASVAGEDGELLAVVVYSKFTAHNCEVDVAALTPRFLNKAVLRDLYAYPFLQCKLRRVTAVVRESNKRSLSACCRLGFKVEGILRNWYADEHGQVLGMLREECKWL